MTRQCSHLPCPRQPSPKARAGLCSACDVYERKYGYLPPEEVIDRRNERDLQRRMIRRVRAA